MNEPTASSGSRFQDLPVNPGEHFKLYFFAAVLNLIQQIGRTLGGEEFIYEKFPFLQPYSQQLQKRGVALVHAKSLAGWLHDLDEWEDSSTAHLPLRALRLAAGFSHADMAALATAGLAEEDPRFGSLFAELQNTANAPPCVTSGLLHSLWPDVSLRQLQSLNLLRIDTGSGPRHLWPAQIPPALWDALNGTPDPRLPEHFEWRSFSPQPVPLFVPEDVRLTLRELPALIASRQVEAIIIRGPQHNGRTRVLESLAQTRGQPLLVVASAARADDPRLSLLGPLATLRNALPVIALDLGPNESAEIPALSAYTGPLGIVLGKVGGLTGRGVEKAISFDLSLPTPALREHLWTQLLPSLDETTRQHLGRRFRLATGHLHRLASLASTQAALNGHSSVSIDDLQHAGRLINRQSLDALAQRIPGGGSWDDLAVNEITRSELSTLEARCRHRELLHASLGATPRLVATTGVRALLCGASGTGKTLAARILASSLGLDLYRIDLASVVNKYIGETEKNLDRIFSRAEELDIVLLLDEGDALLTQRTAVQTSNDRYANLETNYLLQRLESFEGILIITTNAGDRIDTAFQRRMDIVVEFTPPDASERRRIWQIHLPNQHAVDHAMLERLSARCVLTGGQIKNATQHAGLLALESGQPLGSDMLIAAVEREYRKLGAPCPLRPSSGARTLEPLSRL